MDREENHGGSSSIHTGGTSDRSYDTMSDETKNDTMNADSQPVMRAHNQADFIPGEHEPGPDMVVEPGASHGEHSQVDHRKQTGGYTYTQQGYTPSTEGTGNSSEEIGPGVHAQDGAGQYGAGQTAGNVTQSQTLGNE